VRRGLKIWPMKRSGQRRRPGWLGNFKSSRRVDCEGHEEVEEGAESWGR
jgi:hypothetical protein